MAVGRPLNNSGPRPRTALVLMLALLIVPVVLAGTNVAFEESGDVVDGAVEEGAPRIHEDRDLIGGLRRNLAKGKGNGKGGDGSTSPSSKSTKAPKSSKKKKKTSKKSKSKKSAPVNPLFDTNMDGVVDIEDLIFVLRAIFDPLNEITPGDLAADVNEDGVVDLFDAANATAFLADLFGQDALGEVTPEFFFPADPDAAFPWDQPPLTGIRRHLHLSRMRPSSSSFVPDFVQSRDLQDDTCGADTALSLAKGPGPKPNIQWDLTNCLFDPDLLDSLSISERLSAHASWTYYGTLATGAGLAGQPDAARAYFHYRGATGNDLSVDYEKGIRQDAAISAAVDQEIADVKAAVREIFNSVDTSFTFHSTSARGVPNGNTDNWRRTLGGHRIWSTGSVTYSESACTLSIDFDINVEDYYNFNPGQQDVGSGLPDDDNCLFAQLGWAKAFFTRGSITRSESIDLECCNDDDCTQIDESKCECNLCIATCPTEQRSGGQGFTSFSVELFQTQGVFEVFYQMYTIPDELNIFYQGSNVFSTGGLVSGSSTQSVSYGSDSSTSTVVTVQINAPNSGTAWDVSVSCPP